MLSAPYLWASGHTQRVGSDLWTTFEVAMPDTH